MSRPKKADSGRALPKQENPPVQIRGGALGSPREPPWPLAEVLIVIQ
jgi:hypothetical protein